MPCYCSTPDSTGQEEIERRSKERMYFYAQTLLTRKQVQECEKIHLKPYPIGDVNERLRKMCKILTDEQMKEISAYQWQIEWEHETLYDWHIQNCIDDINHKRTAES